MRFTFLVKKDQDEFQTLAQSDVLIKILPQSSANIGGAIHHWDAVRNVRSSFQRRSERAHIRRTWAQGRDTAANSAAVTQKMLYWV